MKKSFSAIFFYLFLVTGCFPLLAQDTPDSNFDTFIKRFTSSAEFQYSRINFPISTPIFLLKGDGEEVEVPFTKEEWPLLEEKDLKECKLDTQDGIFFGRFTVKDKDHVEFESGLEESELDLSITFDLIDGKWMVTDCYSSWYGGISVDDFDATVYEVQQRNEEFTKRHP